jgi:hypothetical protein
MVASNKLNDHEDHRVPIGKTGMYLLRSAVIYGANAAGKSNLIRAMDTAQRLIRDPSERRPIAPFRFQTGTPKPSSFEFRFLIGDRIFIYGFDILKDTVTSEWLALLKGDGDSDVVYDRDDRGAVTVHKHSEAMFPDDSKMFPTLTALAQVDILGDQLFLNRILSIPVAAQGVTLSAIAKWFLNDLTILPANSRSIELIDRLHDDSRFRTLSSAFLNNVGTGVGELDIVVVEREGNDWEKRFLAQHKIRRVHPFMGPDISIVPKPDNPSIVMERKLFSEHRVEPNKYQLPFSEESDGTQSLLHLMPILASQPNETRVVVLDELDRSLHPLICWEFIKFFSESCVGSHKQLIVTTHEVHLLNQDLLRRDEYWFAEKDKFQQTRLSSLNEYGIRNDLKIEKGYLQGRFGGIPVIGGMHELERLLECSSPEELDAAKEATT